MAAAGIGQFVAGTPKGYRPASRPAKIHPLREFTAGFGKISSVKRFDKPENSYILSLLYFLSTGAGVPPAGE